MNSTSPSRGAGSAPPARTAFIINPASAAGRTGRRWSRYRPAAESLFPGATFHLTSQPGEAKRLARELAEGGATDLLVGVGGDGTFNEIVNGLFRNGRTIAPELTFATLPMGTASDLVRTVGVARAPDQALRQLAAGRSRRLDVGWATLTDFAGNPHEHYFLNGSNSGLGGHAAYLVNHSSKRFGGTIAFFVGVLRALWEHRNRSVVIRAATGTVLYQGLVANIAVANGRYCGGGMNIAPSARMDDGQMELLIVKGRAKSYLLRAFPRIYFGAHVGLPAVDQHKVDAVTVESDEEVLCELDGETPGRLPLTIRCLPAALAVRGISPRE